MIQIILTIIITYIVVSLFGYVSHYLLHKSIKNSLSYKYRKAHMTHHKLYTYRDYLSIKYRDAGKDDTLWIFVIISIPLLLLPIILCIFGLLPLNLTIICIIEMLLFGWANDYVHNCFHIENHWIFKVPIINKLFYRWRRLHKLHHLNGKKNLGIFYYHWDFLFKTFWDKKDMI